MVRESTETAWPAEVMTETRPVVAPIELSSEALTLIEVPLPDVLSIVLLRQNFTVTVPVNPVPVIVRVPPPEREIVKVESDVIDGGCTVEVSSEVAPLRPMPLPLPT